jgi:hypothetical protein
MGALVNGYLAGLDRKLEERQMIKKERLETFVGILEDATGTGRSRRSSPTALNA